MKSPIEIRARYIFYPIIIVSVLFYLWSGFHGISGMLSDDATEGQNRAFGLFLALSFTILLACGLFIISKIGKFISKHIKIID